MFKTLNDKYQKAISDTDDEKLIMESITGSDIDAMIDDPSIEQAAEEEVDVYSVPKQDLDKLDKFADKIVSSADYDDDDLDDMLDSDYDESEIVVAESVSVETPTYDKVGTYNAGIQSGEVDYKMTDCEDRGGVGVNPVIARNNQLSEAVINMNFEMTDVLLREAAGNKPSVRKTIAKGFRAAINALKALARKIFSVITGPIRALTRVIRKQMEKIKNKGNVKVNLSIYGGVVKQAAKTIADIEAAIPKGNVENISGKADKIVEAANAIEVKEGTEYVPASNAVAKIINSGADKDLENAMKRVEKIISELESFSRKFESLASGHRAAADLAYDEVNDPDDLGQQERATQQAVKHENKAGAYQTEAAAANKCIAACHKLLEKVTKIVAIDKANREAIVKLADLKEDMDFSKNRATNESAVVGGDIYMRALRHVNENCNEEFVGYFDESTGMYFFGFELAEAAGNAKTYAEFKENLKNEVAPKVPQPNFGKKPTSDLSDRDPARPLLKNAPTLAKNTLCQAYTADQLKSIPASKMPTVRKAITEMIGAKSAAYETLRESYANHSDNQAVRNAILEDAEAIRIDLENLKNTQSIIESIEMGLIESADTDLDDFLSESIDADWLTEDSEADLDDIDLDADDDKGEKDSDDKKDDKKSKKSDKDDDECDDEECKDDDKKSEDSKKSDDKKDDDDKDEKKSDKKEEKDDDLDENASLLEAISALMDELD